MKFNIGDNITHRYGTPDEIGTVLEEGAYNKDYGGVVYKVNSSTCGQETWFEKSMTLHKDYVPGSKPVFISRVTIDWTKALAFRIVV